MLRNPFVVYLLIIRATEDSNFRLGLSAFKILLLFSQGVKLQTILTYDMRYKSLANARAEFVGELTLIAWTFCVCF